jgi:hypothetical protein
MVPDNVPMQFQMDDENNPIGFEAQIGGGRIITGKKINPSEKIIDK